MVKKYQKKRSERKYRKGEDTKAVAKKRRAERHRKSLIK